MAFFVRDGSSAVAPTPAAPESDRAAELTRAEEAMRTAEVQLALETERIAREAVALTDRAQALESEASSLGSDPELVALLLRIREPTPVPAVAAHVERSLGLRLTALESRRKSAEAIRSVLRACGEALAERARSLAADGQTVARARTRAAETAAASAQAAVVAARRAPPPTPVESDSTTGSAPPVAAAPSSTIGKIALKRVMARVAMHTQVDLASDSNFFTGFSTNISEGGLFVATVNVLPSGTPVDVTFTLPGGKRLTVKGEVRWTREINDRTPEVFPGVGVRFTEVDPELVSQIKTFVQQREPLFYPD